jgi:transcriptional regulator GlxA family with amidase domain
MLTASPAPRKIGVLATPTAQSLEVAAPMEVFCSANFRLREAGREHAISYEVALASTGDDLKITSTTSGPHKPSGSQWDEQV